MRKLKLPQGHYNFRDMLESSDFIFDKSLFIHEVLESGEEAIMITRPRRWGKSINLDMLKKFLAIEVDEKGNPFDVNPHRVLFEGGNITTASSKNKLLSMLEIAKVDNGSYIDEHQGKSPVILFSLKDVIGASYEEVESKLKSKISELFKEFRYLQRSDKFYDDEKQDFQSYLDKDYSKSSVTNAINFLGNLLQKYHGKNVFILIDEYDRPVNYLLARTDTLSDKYVIRKTADLITELLGACGKDVPYLNKIILMGIRDIIAKDGSSGFNNLEIHGVAAEQFGKSFGFSEKDVFALIDIIDFGDNTDLVKTNIKNWYNGYSVPVGGGEYQETYNPRAVVSYLSDAMEGRFTPGNYWTASGTQDILLNLFKKVKDIAVHDKFSSLLKGNEVELGMEIANTLEKQTNPFDDITDITRLLLEAGYLTVRKEKGKTLYKIPNKEVYSEFEKVATQHLKELGVVVIEGQNALELHVEHLKALVAKKKLEELKKTTLELIQSDDASGLQRAFEDESIKSCEMVDSKFNLFHLAALKGSTGVITTLLKNCDKEFLSAPDAKYGLKPIDYAKLSGDEHALNLMGSYDRDALSLTPPDLFNEMACHDFGAMDISFAVVVPVVLMGTIKHFSKPIIKKFFDISDGWLLTTSATLGTTLGKLIHKYYSKDAYKYCNKYYEYKGIDISSLDSIKEPIQFEKYIVEHEKAYVRINAQCDKVDTQIASINLPIYDLKDSEVLVLNLCDYETPKAEL